MYFIVDYPFSIDYVQVEKAGLVLFIEHEL